MVDRDRRLEYGKDEILEEDNCLLERKLASKLSGNERVFVDGLRLENDEDKVLFSIF